MHGSAENVARGQDGESGESFGYLNQHVDTEQTRLWMAQHDQDEAEDASTAGNAFVYNGPAGVQVLGIHKNILVGGVLWGLIAEIDEQQAFARPTD